MSTSNERQFAVVTGASSGIGLELAKIFAENNFDLLVTAEDEGITSAARAFEQLGASVRSVRADLATHDGVHALVREIEATGRPIDAIAINAGVGVGGPFLETELDDELNLIALNVTSSVHLAKHVLRGMVDRGSGRVLFTASIAAQMPAPFEAVYGASKAFVHSFAEALRNELKDTGVTVTSLMPGPTETNFFHRAGMDDTRVGAGKKADAAEVAREGFDALMAGKAQVVAGSLGTKIQSVLAEVIPETTRAEMHRHLSEPGSADK